MGVYCVLKVYVYSSVYMSQCVCMTRLGLHAAPSCQAEGKVYVVRRGSQRWKQRKSSAPLAKQESFSDWVRAPILMFFPFPVVLPLFTETCHAHFDFY